jgi:dihydroflavonol-4-reductase
MAVGKSGEMKAIVTGSTGFVGANLCAALVAHGWSVRALHRASSRLIALESIPVEHATGDVNEPRSLAAAIRGCDVVFHVAAVADYWRQSAEKLYCVNVEGTRAVCQAALDAKVSRLVFTSSVASLGIPKPGQLADESHEFNLPPERFRYGHSKLLAEGVVREFESRGLDAVIVNPSIILGPGDLNEISGSIVTEVARRRSTSLVYPPGGINYIDVRDVCAGHIAAAERGRTGERYILAAHNLAHYEAMKIVAKVLGTPAPRIGIPRALVSPLAALLDLAGKLSPRPLPMNGDQMRLSAEFIYFDASKAIRELGLPQTPFRQTVEQTYQWYKTHGHLT